MFSYIKIEDFCNLTNFEMEFENKKDTISNINLNVLIGKNGTGKSCLLDALFEIGTNNLKSKEAEEDATSFKYQIKSICGIKFLGYTQVQQKGIVVTLAKI